MEVTQDRLRHLSLRLIKVNMNVMTIKPFLLLTLIMEESANKKMSKRPSFGAAGTGRLRSLGILMGVTMLGITTFQIYWLKQNYDREKKNLLIKTEITFRETVRNLQGLKFKLNKIFPDSSGRGNVRIFVDGRGHGIPKVRRDGKAEIVETINILNEK